MLSFIRLATVAVGVIAAGASVAGAAARVNGVGATFPNPIYQRWIGEYKKVNSAVTIDYSSQGSGKGISALISKTADFAGSDAPMSKKEIDTAGLPVVHIPTVAGGVVPAYNIPDFSGELKLTGEVIARIYLGEITNWNDSAIAELNPGATLPDLQIVPAYRTDGSGTTFVFTSYLAGQSDAFKQKLGASKQVEWPVGQGGKGSEGVTHLVQSVAGAIGYIELNYAEKNKIPFASVKNKAGKFVKADAATIAAATDAAGKADTLAVNIWDQPGDKTYPISAFTYVILYKNMENVKSAESAQSLVDFLAWATTDGQKLVESEGYAPLSETVQKKVNAALGTLTFQGKALKPATK